MKLQQRAGWMLSLAALLSATTLAQSAPENDGREASDASAKDKIARLGIRAMEVWRVSGERKEMISVVTYDRAGNTMQQTGSDAVSFRYDSEGRVVERTSTGGMGSRRTVFAYDSNGRVVQAVSYRPDGRPSVTLDYVYDGKGRQAELHTKAVISTLGSSSVFRYDGRDNLVEIALHSGSGIKARSRYRYDEHDQVVELLRSDAGGRTTNRTVFEYDGEGNMTRMASYNGRGQLFSEAVRRYDKGGRVIEAVAASPAANLLTSTSYTYDGNGMLLEEVKYNKRKVAVDTRRFVYQYYPR